MRPIFVHCVGAVNDTARAAIIAGNYTLLVMRATNAPSFKFTEFTGTYLQSVRIAFSEVAHLLYLFVLGVPAYRCRNYLRVSLKTAQRLYTLFRHAIYDHCMRSSSDRSSSMVKLKWMRACMAAITRVNAAGAQLASISPLVSTNAMAR